MLELHNGLSSPGDTFSPKVHSLAWITLHALQGSSINKLKSEDQFLEPSQRNGRYLKVRVVQIPTTPGRHQQTPKQ